MPAFDPAFAREAAFLVECCTSHSSLPNPSRSVSGLDWNWILRWAMIHDVVPRLLPQLERCAGEAPQSWKRFVREYSDAIQKYRLEVLEELSVLCNQFTEAAIETLIWPVGAEDGKKPPRIFPRGMNFFVREKDLDRAIHVLASLGFQRRWPVRIAAHFARTETHLLFESPEARGIVSLRWAMPGRGRLPASIADVWSRRIGRSLRGLPISIPGEQDSLLLSAMAGTEGHWQSLSRVCEVLDIAERLPAIQWEEVLQNAENAGCRKNVLLALDLAAYLGNMNLPAAISAEIETAGFSQRRQFVLNHLFAFDGGGHRTIRDLRWDWGLLDSPRQQVRYLTRFLFTPTAADYSGSIAGKVFRPWRLFSALAGIPLGQARKKIAPAPQSVSTFLASEFEVVDLMLGMAAVGPGDVLYDLGCGDGRIVIRAAVKHGARGVGIDLDPVRIQKATENARRSGVERLVRFELGDLMTAEIREANVVMLFLPASSHLELGATLGSRLRAGTRVVSHGSDIGTWEEARVAETGSYPQAVFLRSMPKDA